MVYTVSSLFVAFGGHITDWLLCPEAILIFVLALILFNVLRLLKVFFVCFCQWKYKDDKKISSGSNGPDDDETDALKKYCHEAKYSDMAAFSLQGRRKTMEDRFSSVPHDYEGNHSVYAVLDGHGGEFAAEYVEEQLFRSIHQELGRGSFQADTDSVKQVLTSLMRTIDAQLICLSRDRMDLSGSTCVLAFQLKDVLTVANVGDSRAVMCTGNGRAVPMSVDHKPCDPKEQKRITEAGGFVTFNGVWRVAGVLATSRAFGDYPLKQRRFVTVEPDFYTVNLSKMDAHFLILATDGLWDVFSNEEAVNFVRGRLDEPHFGAKSLALQAYYRGSLDNITVMVIHLKRKRLQQRKHSKYAKHASFSSSSSPVDDDNENVDDNNENVDDNDDSSNYVSCAHAAYQIKNRKSSTTTSRKREGSVGGGGLEEAKVNDADASQEVTTDKTGCGHDGGDGLVGSDNKKGV